MNSNDLNSLSASLRENLLNEWLQCKNKMFINYIYLNGLDAEIWISTSNDCSTYLKLVYWDLFCRLNLAYICTIIALDRRHVIIIENYKIYFRIGPSIVLYILTTANKRQWESIFSYIVSCMVICSEFYLFVNWFFDDGEFHLQLYIVILPFNLKRKT